MQKSDNTLQQCWIFLHDNLCFATR